MTSTDSLNELRIAIDTLRSPGGCPWDAEQTHRSLLPYLIEECYEFVDAVESGSRGDMVEELGDVLWQVLFHARVGEEDESPYALGDVADALLRKVVDRHPHVFARDAGGDSVDIEWVEGAWERIKAAEKSERESIFDGIPSALPALTRAHKVIRKIGRAGIAVDPPASGRPDAAERLGERLLALVREAEESGVDAEGALRGAVRGLESRARAAEAG